MIKRLYTLSTAILLASSTPALSQIKPALGIVSSLENDALLHESGFHLIGESVGNLLSPNISRADFLIKLQALKKARCQVHMCNTFFPGQLKIAGDKVNEQTVLAYADTVFSRASQAGIYAIVLGSGGARRLPEGYDVKKAIADFIKLSGKLAVLAKVHGVKIFLEALNSTETNFITTLKDAAYIVNSVNHKNFRLNADIYHMLKENEPAQHIIDAGSIIEYCEIAEKDERTYPGFKGDDFVPYLKALQKIKYQGPIFIEGRWTDLKTEAPLAKAYMTSQLQLAATSPTAAAAQTAQLKIKVSNSKDDTVKIQTPLDGTWFFQQAKAHVLGRDSSVSVSVPLTRATWVRINGYFIIVEPGLTNIWFDDSLDKPLRSVDRNMEGIRLFAERNTEFYQTVAKAYYKKDSTAAGLIKLIEQDRRAQLEPYSKLLSAKKISTAFYSEIDHYLKVQANILEAAIPMIVFSETKKLNADLDRMWAAAYTKLPLEDIQNTFNPDFFYHADYYAFTYLTYYLPLKQGKKLDVKDESAYLKLKYEGLSKTFKGKMREFMLASFVRNEMMQNRFQPVLLELFADFQRQYPHSAYTAYMKSYARSIESFLASKQAQPGTKQKIIPEYGKVDSFEQLLGKFKGKDVFIDVWATWCGPCKEEFKYGKELAQFLDSNNVEMLFISTDKDEADEQWKTMIKYYQLDGWHVRTNKSLLQDMLNKFWDGKGYAIPRYILVSDGKVVNPNMLRPSDKEKLYNQVESLLGK
ncbi:TIM barrel protein [Pedobacter faecalis]|uniref:TIM barrel protein n=1 Tax=Pedobacter faecalis TaxID=3041495 RepID=UPI002551C4A6|nr:TIM barrel protein [Pedobacter sp. ELA7]